jgi:nucleoside-diphosphate kinase
MAIERTLSMIKPDAVASGLAGKILQHFEDNGLKVVACRRLTLTLKQARAFYAVHAERPFYDDLVAFMTEGPIYAQVLEGEGAVLHYRKVIGATDPADADEGTVRKLYAESKSRNAVHGSDSVENAAIESAFFFPGCDLL